jgi:hypothetical protein
MSKYLRLAMIVPIILIIISFIHPWWSLTVSSIAENGTVLLQLNPISPIAYTDASMEAFFYLFSGGMSVFLGIIMTVLFWVSLLFVILVALFSYFRDIGWGTVAGSLVTPIVFLVFISILTVMSGVSWFSGSLVSDFGGGTTYTLTWNLGLGWLSALFAAEVLIVIRVLRYWIK